MSYRERADEKLQIRQQHDAVILTLGKDLEKHDQTEIDSLLANGMLRILQ